MGLLAFTFALGANVGVAQEGARTRSGAELYSSACASCHGADGTGNSQSRVGFDTPLPDFTDCSFASPEADPDWYAVVHEGGPVRAFDRRMPAFGEALTESEIFRVLGHVRTFCKDKAWPRGELNLPRPLFTEKAFPENELVWVASVGDKGESIVNELEYEQRVGTRSQIEIGVPFEMREDIRGDWKRGLGDVSLGWKYVLGHSLESGTILSLTSEVTLPTGEAADGLGDDVTVFEPFLSFGQTLPWDAFIHAQAGLEYPFDRDRKEKELFWRVALGNTWVPDGFGRAWSPMIELLGSKELEHGEPTLWSAVPQLQVSLNTRQHMLLAAGVELPLNERSGRDPRFRMYVLWDWADGGLFEGW